MDEIEIGKLLIQGGVGMVIAAGLLYVVYRLGLHLIDKEHESRENQGKRIDKLEDTTSAMGAKVDVVHSSQMEQNMTLAKALAQHGIKIDTVTAVVESAGKKMGDAKKTIDDTHSKTEIMSQTLMEISRHTAGIPGLEEKLISLLGMRDEIHQIVASVEDVAAKFDKVSREITAEIIKRQTDQQLKSQAVQDPDPNTPPVITVPGNGSEEQGATVILPHNAGSKA